MHKTKYKITFVLLMTLAVVLFTVLSIYSLESVMLNPKGIIALKERNLMIIATLLMLIVVIPVLLITFYVCIKYRATNKKALYRPDWDNNLLAECVWWGLPCLIILALSILTWQSSHELDPFKPLESDKKPLKIQVVALQWKWLFIYPEQKIASVNFFQFPEQTPLNLELTADAPMNSLWIPQLGGQIYAMPAMKTKLHLIANEKGVYRGSSANISGEGFAGMTFKAKASTQEEFEKWVEQTKGSSQPLDEDVYTQLALPSAYHPVTTYQLKDEQLFDQIIMKYMMPPQKKHEAHSTPTPSTTEEDKQGIK